MHGHSSRTDQDCCTGRSRSLDVVVDWCLGAVLCLEWEGRLVARLGSILMFLLKILNFSVYPLLFPGLGPQVKQVCFSNFAVSMRM